MIPGIFKETLDRKTTGFSGKDLAADAVGAAVGVLTGGFIVSYSRRTNETRVSYSTQF
jgi:hypothetical protein